MKPGLVEIRADAISGLQAVAEMDNDDVESSTATSDPRTSSSRQIRLIGVSGWNGTGEFGTEAVERAADAPVQTLPVEDVDRA